MLRELTPAAKSENNSKRVFVDGLLELIVWFSDLRSIKGFQLCYGRDPEQRAFTWSSESGYSHDRVDVGEHNPIRKQAPILVADGVFPKSQIMKDFSERSLGIDSAIRQFVLSKLRDFG